MKTQQSLLLVAALCVLTACGTVTAYSTSSSTLIEKTAKATGEQTTHLNVVPQSQQGSVDHVKYHVRSTRGIEYICVYEVESSPSNLMKTGNSRGSDAVCAKLTS